MSDDKPITIEQLCNWTPQRFESKHGINIEDATPADELPVTLERNTRYDPIDGEAGSVKKVVEEDCPNCGYDRANLVVVTTTGDHAVQCRVCDHRIE